MYTVADKLSSITDFARTHKKVRSVDFVESVRQYYVSKGFVTPKQEAALDKIIRAFHIPLREDSDCSESDGESDWSSLYGLGSY
jgi:hypothetical protein